MERIVVVGASAGGVEALARLVGGLPADFPAPVVVVQHVPRAAVSAMPAILDRAGPLPAVSPEDGAEPKPGTVYVAPPDFHLLVGPRLRLVRGPQENGHRPAIDPLFRSAAISFGARAIAVVLTGTRDDGAAGVVAVAARGGEVVVQDPGDALYPSMPESAIAADHPRHVLPLNEIPAVLDRLAREPVDRDEEDAVSEDDALEQSFAAFETDALEGDGAPGRPSGLACPACGGVLWEAADDPVLRFRCRVGHAFNAESLLEAEDEALEAALWTALRALEERADLSRRLARRLRGRGPAARAEAHERRAAEAVRHGRLIRDVLLRENGDPDV